MERENKKREHIVLGANGNFCFSSFQAKCWQFNRFTKNWTIFFCLFAIHFVMRCVLSFRHAFKSHFYQINAKEKICNVFMYIRSRSFITSFTWSVFTFAWQLISTQMSKMTKHWISISWNTCASTLFHLTGIKERTY